MILLSAGVFIVGCNKDDTAIRTYSAPKDVPAPQVASADAMPADGSPADADSTANAPPLNWTVPQGWKPVQGGDPMRVASFSVAPEDPKALVTVIPLGPEAAALWPNVKRWAGILKLPDVTEADVPKFVHQTQVSGEQGQIVEMTGASESGNPPVSLLSAIVPHEGTTWFFTLKAAAPIVEAQKANFEKFVHSVQFSAARPGTEADASPAGPTQADDAHGDPAASNQSFKLAQWKTPAGWQEEPGANTMRVTAFRIGPASDDVEVIVSRIARGQMGSFTDNINRWRDQVGLDPVASISPGMLQPTGVAGHGALSLTLTGPKDAAGMAKQLTVVMSIEGRDFWFIKMLGPESVVAKQRDALKQFLDSMHFEPEAQ
jgi:hypothetical protein